MTENAKTTSVKVNEVIFKVILIGDAGTGKTSLITRYIRDQFQKDYKVTIGVQCSSKMIIIDQNHRVRLQIIDTAGQQSFRSIVKNFYRNSAAVLLIYNITSKNTFQSLKSWIMQARQNSPQNAIFILMGTHLDNQKIRQVKVSDAKQFMNKQEIAIFFQTSSKTAENVNKAFDQIAKQLFLISLEKSKKQKPVDNKTIAVTVNSSAKPDQKMFGCC